MANAEAVAREFMEAWNQRDWAKYRSMFGEGYSYTGGDGQRLDGADAGIGVGQMFANAFPDGKIEIKHIHAAGDVVIVEFLGTGTHQGDLMGIAPTGRKMSMPVCNVITVRDGKIASEREYMDMAHMMQQLGVMPAPATA